MRLFVPKDRPEPWTHGREKLNHAWMVPFFAVEWGFEWVTYFLSNWKFLEVLEYLGSLSVLIAVIFYFSERKNQMADVQVTCITKPRPDSPHEHITHLGNPQVGWERSREQVIASIDVSYFVRPGWR